MIPSIFVSTGPDTLLGFLPADVPGRNTYAGLICILTTAGEATVEIDGRPYTLQPGTLLTLLPAHLLSTTAKNAGFHCLILSFTFDAMTAFPYMLQSLVSEKMERTPFIRLTPVEQKKVESWYQVIASHYEQVTHPSYQEILRSLIFVFTAEVSTIYSGKPVRASANHSEELTDNFFRLLHQYFRTNRQTAFYAGRLCVTSKYLSRVIRQVTGHVPMYWIANFTVREAKMLLKSTTLTVTQLSEQLNFPNSSFFARYFKRYAGIAPQEYRLGEDSRVHSAE